MTATIDDMFKFTGKILLRESSYRQEED